MPFLRDPGASHRGACTIDLQMVHPQKRISVKKALKGTMGRLLRIKSWLVKHKKQSYVNLDDILVDLKLTPDVLELPVPNYFIEDRKEELKQRDELMDTISMQHSLPGPYEEEEEELELDLGPPMFREENERFSDVGCLGALRMVRLPLSAPRHPTSENLSFSSLNNCAANNCCSYVHAACTSNIARYSRSFTSAMTRCAAIHAFSARSGSLSSWRVHHRPADGPPAKTNQRQKGAERYHGTAPPNQVVARETQETVICQPGRYSGGLEAHAGRAGAACAQLLHRGP